MHGTMDLVIEFGRPEGVSDDAGHAEEVAGAKESCYVSQARCQAWVWMSMDG